MSLGASVVLLVVDCYCCAYCCCGWIWLTGCEVASTAF